MAEDGKLQIPEDLKRRYDHLATYKPMEVAVTTIYVREWLSLIERIAKAENEVLRNRIRELEEKP